MKSSTFGLDLTGLYPYNPHIRKVPHTETACGRLFFNRYIFFNRCTVLFV